MRSFACSAVRTHVEQRILRQGGLSLTRGSEVRFRRHTAPQVQQSEPRECWSSHKRDVAFAHRHPVPALLLSPCTMPTIALEPPSSPRPPILVLSTLMGVMLRRIEQSRPLRRQHFEPREPGIGRAPSARDRRKGTAASCRAFQDGDDLLRISNRLAPSLGALLPSPLLGRLLVRVPMPRRWGPMAGGYQRARSQPAYLFLVCQLFGCLDPAFGER